MTSVSLGLASSRARLSKAVAVTYVSVAAMTLPLGLLLHTAYWPYKVAVALLLALLYVALGAVNVVMAKSLNRLVGWHVFRTLLIGGLLVVVPTLAFGSPSPATLMVFMLVHIVSWCWLFGRRNSRLRHTQWTS